MEEQNMKTVNDKQLEAKKLVKPKVTSEEVQARIRIFVSKRAALIKRLRDV